MSIKKRPQYLHILPDSRLRHSAWRNGCDTLSVMGLHENWTLALRCQPSRRPKKRPVKSKKKLCYFGVVSYKADKYRVSKYGKKEEWILIFENQLDRINRIVRIERPSAERPLAAGEKNPVNPVNPV